MINDQVVIKKKLYVGGGICGIVSGGGVRDDCSGSCHFHHH